MTRFQGASRNRRAKGFRSVLPFSAGSPASSLKKYGGLYRFLILQTRLWVLLTAAELEAVGALNSPALKSQAGVGERASVHRDPWFRSLASWRF